MVSICYRCCTCSHVLICQGYGRRSCLIRAKSVVAPRYGGSEQVVPPACLSSKQYHPRVVSTRTVRKIIELLLRLPRSIVKFALPSLGSDRVHSTTIIDIQPIGYRCRIIIKSPFARSCQRQRKRERPFLASNLPLLGGSLAGNRDWLQAQHHKEQNGAFVLQRSRLPFLQPRAVCSDFIHSLLCSRRQQLHSFSCWPLSTRS